VIHTIMNALFDPVHEVLNASINSRLLTFGAICAPTHHPNQLPSSGGASTLQRTARISHTRVSAALRVSGTQHRLLVELLAVPVVPLTVLVRHRANH